MHYEIRGIFEEHGQAIVMNAAADVAANPDLREELSKDELINVSIESSYSRLMGFYKMFCIIKNVKVEHMSDLNPEINEIIEKNYDAMIHNLDDTIRQIEQEEKYPADPTKRES